MLYSVSWFMKGRIVLARFSGDMDAHALEQALEQVGDLYREVQTRDEIHLIVHEHLLDELPDVNTLLRVTPANLPNLGWIVIVDMTNDRLRNRTNIVNRHLNLRFRRVRSIHDAATLLQKLDRTLPDLSTIASQYPADD